MNNQNVTIFKGLPGSGKTSMMLDEMVGRRGRYILAAPRTALIDEHVATLKKYAAYRGTSPIIHAIHSDQEGVGRVQRRVADACRELAQAGHVILAITHEGLQSVDPMTFKGWHMGIDEIPHAVASGSLRVPVGAMWLDNLYDLQKVEGTKWSKVTAKAGAPSIGYFMQDDFARQELAAFHKRVLCPAGLLVNVEKWSDAIGGSKPIRWWSLWSPRDLAESASIKIASSGYSTSLCALATDRFYPGEIECRFERVGAQRAAQPEVRVHYFAALHRGSTAFWEQGDGRKCLDSVGRRLSNVEGLGFWSGNETVRNRFGLVLPGEQVLPRLAGTNAYRHLTSCALIYSNKAQDRDAALLEVFDLTKDEIARAREIEDIQQFVMRGAIRNTDFAGRYDIYLYDLTQAEAVRDYLHAGGISDVTLHGIKEAGIMDFERPKPGPKPVQVDERTKAERQAERRKKDAARKKRARSAERARKKRMGDYRAPGRPSQQRASSVIDEISRGRPPEPAVQL